MTRIAIVGGHGKIARLLIPLLARRRTPAGGAGAQPGLLAPSWRRSAPRSASSTSSRTTPTRSPRRSPAADAVVFAAGGGPDGNIERKRTVDLGGLAEVDRGRHRPPASAGSCRSRRSASTSRSPADAGDVWRAYVEAKRDADVALRDSDLDWTIIRPGGLHRRRADRPRRAGRDRRARAGPSCRCRCRDRRGARRAGHDQPAVGARQRRHPDRRRHRRS